MHNCEAIVIGASAGGSKALDTILSNLPENFSLPVILVQHRMFDSDNYFVELLNNKCALLVKEADEKEHIKPGVVYIAPPDYHLLIEKNKTLSLSIDEPVRYARPSIDVLFESASETFGAALVGILLTGANNDGSDGIKKIKENGGLTVVQDPSSAEFTRMPDSAIATNCVDHILPLDRISQFIVKIWRSSNEIK